MERIENKENVTNVKKPHKLIVEGRKAFTIFGVTEVLETTGGFLSVKLAGEILSIKGSEISIKKLAIEEGILEAAGVVDEVKYAHKRERIPLLKKIFK